MSHILIVEDDADIQEAFQEILTDNGYQVSVADNGRKALNLLATQQDLPDLILLDVLMPEMDGFGFRELQLQDKRIKHIPVIVLSASHKLVDLADKMKTKAYLKKPINIEDLLAAVEENLR